MTKITTIVLASLLSHSLLLALSLASFTPVDNYLIVCGASKRVDFEGRTFVPDSDHSSLVVKSGESASSTSAKSPSPIHDSARVFSSTGSFRFEIEQKGRHWIRLHFYPIRTRTRNLAKASMSVVAENFVLMEDFSFKGRPISEAVTKEYSVNVTVDFLTLTFVPANGSVAFVNAIEVVSIPDGVFPQKAQNLIPFAGELSALATETVFRLNMGGPAITPANDTLGRSWETDEKYLHVNSSAVSVKMNPASVKYPPENSPEIAPNLVYATAEAMGDANVSNDMFNVTWVFEGVDSRFEYLIRAHFCDVVSKSLNVLVFSFFVNDAAALSGFDMSSFAGDLEVPLFRDFVAGISAGEGESPAGTMTVSVGPDSNSDESNAILNGLEIMRLSNEFRSLAGESPAGKFLREDDARRGSVKIIIGCAVGAMSLAILAIGFLVFAARRRRVNSGEEIAGENSPENAPWLPLPMYNGGGSTMMTKMSTNSNKSGGTASCISLGRYFTIKEIMEATGKFDEGALLGVGGFGRVYRGTLEDGTKVAVKRGNSRSEQGMAEFRTEIEMLSKLRHRHLVSLIGYCDQRSEMILVYEYMANGPLRSHLYGAGLPPLTWRQRLEVCIGSARGLHYLHTGAAQSVIHRDVKTTNILLDDALVAKVADFGLSKAGPAIDQTHVSTAVKGSFGYLDPEYFRRQQLTEKSDVYSFGVVLVEVLCTRPALNPVLPRDQVNIAEWAMTWQRKGMLDQIVDPNLAGKVDPASLRKFGETAEKCLAEHGADRPSMGDVLWNLEYALQLQEASAEAAAAESPLESSTNHITGIPIVGGEYSGEGFENSLSVIGANGASTDEDAATSAVFSQLVHPRGR